MPDTNDTQRTLGLSDLLSVFTDGVCDETDQYVNLSFDSDTFDKLRSTLEGMIVFRGRASGDCECFCWDEVPCEDAEAFDTWSDAPNRLYPNEIVATVKADEIGKRFEFIFGARRIDG